MENTDLEYVGFWLRVWAVVIDTVIVSLVALPVLTWIYGREYWSSTKFINGPLDFLISWIFPAIAVVIFWNTKQATPGKLAIGAQIVDAKTGGKPTTSQLIIRYIGYFVSTIPLCLGLVWVAFDPRKQGWHDKLADTVVIRKKGGTVQTVKFGG